MNYNIPTYEGLEQNQLPNVYKELLDFDTKYMRYVQCNDKTNNPNNNVLKCSNDELSTNYFKGSYEKLMGKINDPNSTGIFIDSLGVYSAKNPTQEEYKKEFNSIINKYQEIKKLRNEIEEKMYDLNDTNTDYKKQYDSSIFTGILLTILASSMLFYTFKQM